MSDDPVHLDESFEAMTLERKLAIQQPLGYIVTIKQRQTKLLGYNSDCPQCSLATMAHRGVLPRYYNVCACVSLDLQCRDQEQYIARSNCVHNR